MFENFLDFFVKPSTPPELPDGHEWCLICKGTGTDDGICPCQACEGDGHLRTSEVENKKKELFPNSHSEQKTN